MENELLELAVRLEQQRETAMMNGDGESLSTIYSDDLSYGHSSGYAESKVEYLRNFNEKNYVYTFVKTTVDKVTGIGNSGLVIVGHIINEAILFGQDVKMHSIYLAVYRLEGQQWRFISHQTALIK